jgi:hypothetical protein
MQMTGHREASMAETGFFIPLRSIQNGKATKAWLNRCKIVVRHVIFLPNKFL